MGRDLLARLLCGGRVSLLIGLCSAALSALVGIPLGLLAGYRRGAWEFCLMRLADVFQSFPSIVLVLCLVSLVGPSALNLVLVLGLLGWTGIAGWCTAIPSRSGRRSTSWRPAPWGGGQGGFCGAMCCPT